ncbi:hypothetical protein K3495_g13957 [Podosphaera aphanis]|nr:hypothetical protein K3495_g13957 [Podosphaera aphanis]
MKCALASHLRKRIAYRQGVSEKNYESFVKEVQSLAKELESIPSFRAIRGSDKDQPTEQISRLQAEQANLQFDMTKMAGISSLQRQIQAQTQAILAVLKGTNGKPSSGNLRKIIYARSLRKYPRPKEIGALTVISAKGAVSPPLIDGVIASTTIFVKIPHREATASLFGRD